MVTATGPPLTYPTAPVPIDNDPYLGINKFVEIFDDTKLTAIDNDEFLSAPLHEICPSGNCIKDCQSMSRVFDALPSGIKADPKTYGRPNGSYKITLFGICSNLEQATVVIPYNKQSKALAPFFNISGNIGLQPSSPRSDVIMATTKIASCFASTCDLTRESDKCKEACAIDNFLATPSRFNFNLNNSNTGSLACISRLCGNTCGLPYANTDVLGIGVLTSYYIQAVALILLGLAFLISAAYQFWSKNKSKATIRQHLKSPLEIFLMVQTYFGLSVAIASLVIHPGSINALNGYVLLAASVMGFMPPVFTLMLLRSHHVGGWFPTSIVTITYALNSVVFFTLIRNLSHISGNSELLGVGLQSLFSTSSCGGSSAMALCHQLTGVEPLMYLDNFFNKGTIPNIKTIPILWGWTTLVLLVLICHQIGKALTGGDIKDGEVVNSKTKFRSIFSFGLLFVAVSGFCLGLAYEFRVVTEYQKMDVIDKKGWTFGQVVAVLFWLAPLLDSLRSIFINMRDHGSKSGEKSDVGGGGRRYTQV